MKILVCIKQAGGTEEAAREIDCFAAFALEEALRLKETLATVTPVTVTVVTVGPQAAAQVIRRAFGCGADSGCHIVTAEIEKTEALEPIEQTEYTSSFITADRLRAVAEVENYDLILTGIMSTAMMAAQTGPLLARMLNLPCATGVVKTRLSPAEKLVEVERELGNGRREVLAIKLPALLTIQAGGNSLRYPKLSNMLAAAQKEIATIPAATLAGAAAVEVCVGTEEPEKTRSGRMLTGSLSAQAEQLQEILQEKNFR